MSPGSLQKRLALMPQKRPYELRTVNEEERLKIVGSCIVEVVFQGTEVPGDAVFEVADNLRRDVQLVIGRPEIDV